jgi:hypothetical protein
MRALRFLNLGILAALIASSAVLYAQDEKQQEEKPRQAEPKQRQPQPDRQHDARPESKQDEMKSPRQDEAKPARPDQQEQRQGERKRNQQEPNRQDQGRQENGRQEAGRQDQSRQERGRQEAGQQQERGRSGGRIPEDRFRAQFGREHHFAMRQPEVVEGRPTFQYGGYSFVLVDAWPPEWAYSDDCYIDYEDGDYFLFNLRHPEMRLALMVVM